MYQNEIREYLELKIKTLQSLDIDKIDEALQLIRETYEKEGTIYIFGNGGSSATASHYQNDFNKGISGSGNSKNVLNAVEYSKTCGNKVIGMTGFDGGDFL